MAITQSTAQDILGKKFMNLPNVKLNPCNLYYPNLGPQGYITESDCRRLTEGKGLFFEKTTLDGEKVRGKKALEMTIDLAQEAGALATSQLKNPHDLEYEKTFMPFCLLSKKTLEFFG